MIFSMKLRTAFLILALFFTSSCALQKETPSAYADDTRITASIKMALLKAPNVRSTDISVETYEGVVQLSGFVNTKRESLKAQKLARKVKGVKSVSNNIIIKDN